MAIHAKRALAVVALMGFSMAAAAAAADPPSAQSVTVPASVEAYEAADQYAKDSGYVSDVKADIGDHVKKGQVMAAIDDPELGKQLDAAKATVAARQEMAGAAGASVLQAQKAVDVARTQLDGARAELALAEVTLKRQEELFAGKAATGQQIDEVRARTQVARAGTATAEAKIAAAEADLHVAEANRAVAAAQMTVAEAEARRLATLLQYTQVVAPFDGVVTRRIVNRGDLVQAATATRTMPLFTVQRIDTVRVFCDVPETDAVWVNPGDVASVRFYGLGGQVISGTVTRIAAALNPETRTMRAEIDLPNPHEKLRPGMYAQVTLTNRQTEVRSSSP